MIARAPPSRHRRARPFRRGGRHDQNGRYPGVLLRERVLCRTYNCGRNAACLTKADIHIHPAPSLPARGAVRIGFRPALDRAQREVDRGSVALVNVKTDDRGRAGTVAFWSKASAPRLSSRPFSVKSPRPCSGLLQANSRPKPMRRRCEAASYATVCCRHR
jgi:hypothetical protein